MADNVIRPDSVIMRNDKSYMTSKVGDEVVMMGIENGNYIGLNGVGSSIWGLLEKQLTVSELCERLIALYDISKEECEKQVLAYLNKMHVQGMLTIIK